MSFHKACWMSAMGCSRQLGREFPKYIWQNRIHIANLGNRPGSEIGRKRNILFSRLHAQRRFVMPASRPVTNVVRTIPPKKAIEILTALIKDAKELEGEPFGSPKRDQLTTTVRGALERTFGPDSSIMSSFGAAQAISISTGDSDETLRKIANRTLASEVSVIQSAIQQLSWTIEGEENVAVLMEASLVPTTMMIFIPHSSQDESLATALVDLLQSAIRGVACRPNSMQQRGRLRVTRGRQYGRATPRGCKQNKGSRCTHHTQQSAIPICDV